MRRRRRQVWFEPVGFHAPRAWAELRVAASQINWLRVVIVCALCAVAVAELVRRYLPEADINWAIFLLRGVGVLALGATLMVLVMMLPRFVQLTKRGIVVQHGQGARIYEHGKISSARVESSGPWEVLRFVYRGRDTEVGLGKNVLADDVIEYLREQPPTT
jgi:hypothetical protein